MILYSYKLCALRCIRILIFVVLQNDDRDFRSRTLHVDDNRLQSCGAFICKNMYRISLSVLLYRMTAVYLIGNDRRKTIASHLEYLVCMLIPRRSGVKTLELFLCRVILTLKSAIIAFRNGRFPIASLIEE